MASWMVHLRISDRFLDIVPSVEKTEFVMGNIAPDSGVPNADWSSYTPDKNISHFKVRGEDGHRHIRADIFKDTYLTDDLIGNYSRKQFSFYLGYYVHLVTDLLWIKYALTVCKMRTKNEMKNDPGAINLWKRDFYDLDAKFLLDHPSFRSFEIFRYAVGFENTFLDFFPPDAFDNRREYIVSFYLSEREGLDREYPYYNESDMSSFVETAVKEIELKIENIIVNKM